MSPPARSERYLAFARRRARIAEAARAGVPFPTIASTFGITAGRVRQVCHAEGLTLGGNGEVGPRAASRGLRARIAAAAGPGVTAEELASRFGVPRRTVQKIARQRRVRLKRPPSGADARSLAERRALARRLAGDAPAAIAGRFPSDRARAIAGLFLSSDLSAAEIARRSGVSHQRACQVWGILKTSVGKPTPRRGRPPRAATGGRSPRG